MSHEYELSQYERYDLVYTREEWLGRSGAPRIETAGGRS
jgi:hypothetical protein